MGKEVLFPVEAYSFEAHFVLKEVARWSLGVTFERRKTNLVGVVEPGGTLFVFDFGAIVFVNVPRNRVDGVVEAICDELAREPHRPLREDFLLVVAGESAVPHVTFDSVVVPRLGPLEVECVATVVAQSVSIDYYDEDLRTVLQRVQQIADTIAKTGRPSISRTDLAKFVASSIGSQVEMIHAMSLLDKPDFTWEDEEAERLYDILRHHFEIAERYRALEAKLATIRESLSQFLEMNATRRSHLLEATIVLLIVFEIVMGLIEMLGH